MTNEETAFADPASVSTDGLGVTDGTFDNRTTMTRQVFQNGFLGLEIPSSAIPFVRDHNGQPLTLVEWGHFPDFPNGSFSRRHEDDVLTGTKDLFRGATEKVPAVTPKEPKRWPFPTPNLNSTTPQSP